MSTPRLLPLIGVAIVGVAAINALGGARDLPRLLSSARAMAEALPAPKTGKVSKPDPAKADPPKPAPAALAPASTAPVPAAGVCAPGAADLARSAGLSPGEIDILQKLQARRGQIDQQSKDLDAQTQLLAAAEVKLDAKLKAMTDLKAQIQGLLGQADQKTQAEVDRLVVVYSKMKPADAAAVMAQLDDKVRVPVAASMKPAVLAAVLGKMPTADAKKLTELLARRFSNVQQLADAAKSPPSPATPPAASAKPAAPAKTATAAKGADAEEDDANVDDTKPAKPKVKQLARHTPPKKKAYKAPTGKKPVDEAKAVTGPKPYSEVKDQGAKPAPATPAAAAART